MRLMRKRGAEMVQRDVTTIYNLIEGMSLKKIKLLQNSFFIILSFFLARAIFFEAAVPFFISFWAIVQTRFQPFRWQAFFGGLAGALTLGLGQLLILFLQCIMFQLLRRIPRVIMPLPIYVALAVFFVQFTWQLLSHGFMPPILVQLYILYEVLLALLMTIFMQLVFTPLFESVTMQWSYEKMGACLFIAAAALTGMDDFTISYFSLAIFVLHLTICLSAYVGTMASTVLIASIVSTVVHIAQLSFTGMLVVYTLTGIFVGASRQLPRIAIAFISVVPSLFFFLYDATLPLDSVYFVSIAMALVVFLLLPKQQLQQLRHYFVPEQEQILVQKERWATVNMLGNLQQFRQFVLFMKDLIFDRFAEQEERTLKKIEPYATCSSCFRYDRCWGEQNNDVALTIQQWFLSKSSNKQLEVLKLEEQLKVKCIKTTKLLEELEDKLYSERLSQQFFYGKKMIALQLRDLTYHIESLMDDLTTNPLAHESLEETIKNELAAKNIQCMQVDVVNSEPGAYKIICSIIGTANEQYVGERVVVPLLQQLLQEPFVVERAEAKERPFAHVQMTFRSSIRFELSHTIYSESKAGFVVSGDSHSVFKLHEGLMGVILSDGVGSSKKAQKESKHLVNMLRNYLTYDLNPETAMHTLHYVLSLKHDASMYATLDVALIDLQYGDLWCWKAGGMMTYILRGEDIIVIESATAPIGFMPNYSVQAQKVSLLAGDTIIMVSDGIFSNVASWQEQETFFLQLLRKFAKQQKTIAALLYESLDAYKAVYALTDDCTVIVMTMNHISAQWATVEPYEGAYTSG